MIEPQQTTRLVLMGSFACASVVLAACGADDESTTTSTSVPSTTTTSAAAAGPTGAGAAAIPKAAHIDRSFGSFEGLEPDGRAGIEPPPVAEPDLDAAAEAAGCELQLELRDEGNKHLVPGQPGPSYETQPPTSGPHSPTPTADGAFTTTPEAIDYVHSLEHGRVEIQYSPDLPEDDQLRLKGVFDEDFEGMLMFPNPEMPYEVAVTAWTNLVGCESFDESVLDVVRDFRDEFRGKGPERVPL